jgi:hypothetical protein
VGTDDDRRGEPRDGLFVWVPKTAGSSVYRALGAHGRVRELWDGSHTSFDNSGLVTFGHMDVRELVRSGVVDEAWLAGAFTFSFVRNPWDRAVSLFHYLQHGERTFEGFVQLLDRELAAQCSLPARVAHRSTLVGRALARARLVDRTARIPPIGAFNVRRLSQANRQVDWITDPRGEIFVDFVGRYENLATDVAVVCDALGIPPQPVPHLNATARRDYREYYSAATQRIVGRLYAADVDTFGYHF